MVTEKLAVHDRVYAIGDVHGHADRLRALHRMIADDLARRPARDPVLVHLGDYIDRGPSSADCLQALLEPAPGLPNTILNLRGNHEQMLLDALDEPDRALLWIQNGGLATLASWGITVATPPSGWRARIPAEHLALLERLDLTFETGRYLFVHAGVRPGIRLAMQAEHDLLWIRDCFLEWDGTMLPDRPELLIVHGHTPVEDVQVRRNRIGIDTNAARGGKLTCARLEGESVNFLQV